MNAEIISCGTELLLGYNVDTNSAIISKSLSRIGIDVYRHITVGDNKERLSGAIKEGLSRADIVITIGGLGPTVDDITTGTIASMTNRDLIFNNKILKIIKGHFKECNLRLPKDSIRQALIPRGAHWLKNDVGTAPGIIIKEDNKYIIALPGPPRELIPMLERDVIPLLKKLEKARWIIKSKSIKLIGLAEANVNEKVKDLLEMSGATTVGIYTHLGELELRITTKAEGEKAADKNIKKIDTIIKRRLGNFIYGVDNETLQETVGEIFTKKRKSLAIAESCTGGYISNLITNIPGSSRYFITGIIAYSNKAKTQLLNIKDDLIKRYGAVSREVAKSMAHNIRTITGADVGLAITGIAGPTGQTKKKPIGLVYIALATKNKDIVKEFRFLGKREDIKLQASQQALNLLRLNV